MENKKSGLATISLIIGIVAVVLSFIPIINNGAFVLGIIAIILGVIPFFKKASRKKAIIGIILGILSVVITLAMQSSISKSLDETSKKLDKITGNSTEEVLQDDVDVSIGDFITTTGEYGYTDTKLTVTVTNKTDSQKSFSIHIEAIDSTGKRIDDDYAYANNLNPNQSQDCDLFQFVQSEDVDNMKNATFKIVEASAY